MSTYVDRETSPSFARVAMGKKKASARKQGSSVKASGMPRRSIDFRPSASARRKRALKILGCTDADLLAHVISGDLEAMDAIGLGIATNDLNEAGGFARLVGLLDCGLLDALIKPFEGANAAVERYGGWKLCERIRDDNYYFIVVQSHLSTLANIACNHHGQSAELHAQARVAIARRMGCLFGLALDPRRTLFGSAKAGVDLAHSLLAILHNVLLPPAPGQSVTRQILLDDPLCGSRIMPIIVDALFATGDQLRARHKAVNGWPLEPMIWSTDDLITQDPSQMLAFRVKQGLAALNEMVDFDGGVILNEPSSERRVSTQLIAIAETPVPQCGEQATLASEFGGLVLELQLLGTQHPELTTKSDWDGLCYIHSRIALGTGPRGRPATHCLLAGPFIEKVTNALQEEIKSNRRVYAIEPMLAMLLVCALDQGETPCDKGVASLVHEGVLQVSLSVLCVCDDTQVAKNVEHLVKYMSFLVGTGPKTRKALVVALPSIEAAKNMLPRSSHVGKVKEMVVGLASKLRQLETAKDCIQPRDDDNIHASNDKGQLAMCMGCHKATPLKHIKKCGNCGTPYCSAKCQKNDWRHGNPPHRAACKQKKANVDAMRAGMSPIQQEAARKSEKSMSEAGREILADRLNIMPVLLMLLGLNEDIRQCLLFCDLTTGEIRVEPVTIDAFFEQRAPKGLEKMSDGVDPHTRAVIERNRQSESLLHSALVRGAGSGPGAPETLILKSLKVEHYEEVKAACAELSAKVLAHYEGLRPAGRDALLQRLIHHGTR